MHLGTIDTQVHIIILVTIQTKYINFLDKYLWYIENNIIMNFTSTIKS